MTFVLNPHRHSAGGGAPGGTITLTDFGRDRLLFDSGAAVGLDYATIPVFIQTSLPNQQIEARVLSVDDGGITSGLWVDMGLTSGLGTFAGSLSAVINRSWYKLEARLKLAPATITQTTNRFGVGHVFAYWGQSELARWWDTAFSNHAPEALITLRQQVEILKQGGKTGRRSTAPLKLPGIDALPSGATLAGRIVELTGTGTLKDWNFIDYEVQPKGGSDWLMQDCRSEETGANLIFALVRVKPGGRIRIKYHSFEGSGKPSSFSAPIVEEQNGPGTIYGKSTTTFSSFKKFPSDAGKLVAGTIRWSYMEWTQNLGGIPTLYNAGTTYALNDLVYVNSGAGPVVHRSKIAGNVGNTPPAKGANDTNWQSVDPHVDPITFLNAHETACVEYCYIDLSQLVIANGGVGANQYVRWQNDDGVGSFTGGTRVRYNVLDRAATTEQVSVPFHVTASFLGNVLIEGNWIRPRHSDNETLYPIGTTIGDRITWAGNTRINTGAALATPPNCITGAFTLETNDDVVQMAYHNRAPLGSGAPGVRHKFIADAAPHTASFVAMANTLLAERPGEKFMVAHHTLSGTGPQTVCTNNASRPWIDEQALHDFVTVGGVKVGVAAASWYASPIGWGTDYGRGWFEITAGTKLDGSTLGSPRVIMSGLAGQFTATNLLSDLYGPYTSTKFCLFGPHRFEEGADLQDATHDVGGAINTSHDLIQKIRTSNKAMLALPAATMFLPKPIDPLSYENGHTNGAGGWTDLAHPNDQKADGLARFARLSAHAVLQSAGLTPYRVPVFDQVTWEAAGAYVDVGSSVGPITTVRAARAIAALPNTYTHWTEVFGWQVNGAPADRAELVAGKVRIYPNSGSFIFSDTIMFGEGGGTGSMLYPEDQVNDGWMNMPLVNVGAYGLEGFPVSAMPPAANLANTLPAPAFFTNPVGALAHFRDNVNWPNVISGSDRVHQRLTFYFDGKVASTGASVYLCALEGGPNFTIEALPGGTFRLNVKDSANVALLTNVGLGSFSFGVRFQLTVTIDINVTNACWSTLNGVHTQRPFTASANPICTASRRMRVLGSASGVSKMAGDVYEIAFWTDHVTGGGNPATDAFLRANGRLVGPAAVANAHPWKQDAALFT